MPATSSSLRFSISLSLPEQVTPDPTRSVESSSSVYVSDGYVNSRVVHFTAAGQFVRTIGNGKRRERRHCQHRKERQADRFCFR